MCPLKEPIVSYSRMSESGTNLASRFFNVLAMLQKMVRYLFLSEFWDMGWLLSVAMVVVCPFCELI